MKNASALNDIERKRLCLFCNLFLLKVGDDLFSQIHFLVAIVRFYSEKLRLDDEESRFSKDFREQFVWINIVNGVKFTTIRLFNASVLL